MNAGKCTESQVYSDCTYRRNIYFFNTSDPVLKVIKKYEKHPSFIKIKEKMKNKSFSFSFLTKETILNKLRKLNPKKAC